MIAQTHDYRYRLEVPGGHSSCRIRIFQEGERTIGLATQVHPMIGIPTLAARTGALATQIAAWHHPARDGQFVWVEQEEYPAGDSPEGTTEDFAIVGFAPGAGPLHEATRRLVGRPAIEELIGAPIAD
jgi:hypothetical protein